MVNKVVHILTIADQYEVRT